ncbi:MAG: NAD(P)/FAD-dependent oxidoreductase [Candidatus Villigracilaceae bacterium]
MDKITFFESAAKTNRSERRDRRVLHQEHRHVLWGLGGSVSALRLAEKGYSVLVLEKGKRFRDQDFLTITALAEYAMSQIAPKA